VRSATLADLAQRIGKPIAGIDKLELVDLVLRQPPQCLRVVQHSTNFGLDLIF
jgi:hypothetical protein